MFFIDALNNCLYDERMQELVGPGEELQHVAGLADSKVSVVHAASAV